MVGRSYLGVFAVQVFVTAWIIETTKGIPQLYFTTEPLSKRAPAGESIELQCSAKGEDPIGIAWRRGQEPVHNLDGRIAVLSNGSLWMQLSEDFKDDPYQCCATNAYGTLCSRTAMVVVSAPLSNLHVLPQYIEAVVNGSARLRCDYSAHLLYHPVRWKKDGENLAESPRYTLLNEGVLQIYPVLRQDAGDYQCITGYQAQSQTWSNSSQVVVIEHCVNTSAGCGEDLIVAGPKGIQLNRPERVVLECLAAGNWVNITWSWTGGKQLPSGRHGLLGHGNLELTDLSPRDSGVYTCTATHTKSGNTTVARARLEITDYYPPIFTIQPTSNIIRDFGTARLHCEAIGNPEPEVSWFLNGNPVHSPSQVANNDLVIWNVEMNDQGIYQCFVSNTAGQAHSSALLLVDVPENPPEPPYNLTALALNSNTVLIQWDAIGVSLFVLQYYLEPDGEEIQLVLSDQKEPFAYAVRNLHPYTNYTFYMRSITHAASRFSDHVVVQTAEGVPDVAPVFSLASSSANTIDVYWDRLIDKTVTKGQVAHYRICYQENGKQDYTCREVSGTNSYFKIQGLKVATIYDVHMAAATKEGFGPESEQQAIRTTNIGNCSVPLKYPLDIPKVLNDTKLVVTWSEPIVQNDIPVDGFRLQLSGVMEDGIKLEHNIFEYVFTDLLPGSVHTFELKAFNDCGLGTASMQTITMPSTTDGGEQTRPPPQNVEAFALSSTSIQVNWDSILETQFQYEVDYRPTSDSHHDTGMKVSSTSGTVVLTKLKPFTIYTLRVRVNQTGVRGQYCDEVYCRTMEDVPSAPVNFSAKPLDAHTVSVAWRPPLNPNGVIKAYTIVYVPDTQQQDREEPQWNKTQKRGSELSSTVKNLTSNTQYYFFLRACTSVGEGPPSNVLRVRTPRESDFMVQPDTGDQVKDMEKGLFIAIILGSICILFCTLIAAIRYKRYQFTREEQLARTWNGDHNGRVPMSRLAQGNRVEIELNAMSPMLARESIRQFGPPNTEVRCESPLLGIRRRPVSDSVIEDDFPSSHTHQVEVTPHCTSEVPQEDPMRQYSHTLPSRPDCGASVPLRHKYPTCSASLPESGSEDGADTSSRWTPLRESTSGDSGLIGDLEFPIEDTSPDFIEKVLREYHLGIHPV
ncbi:protogenin B-like isoform X2 [Asterias amurensis]|uniref:protogenin B-like isoform X2 n=1 Tax=Asterias amurensis TaxID=7602 RepID=UPI003AB25A0B